MNVNVVMLGGNITRDVELKYTPSGTAVAGIGLAVNRKWKDGDGNQKEDVLFVDCTSFGKQAEVMGQYLKKGSPVFIQGRLKLDRWEDKNSGDKKSKIHVIVESFQFVGTGNGGESGGGKKRGSGKSSGKKHGKKPKHIDDPNPDDDVPY